MRSNIDYKQFQVLGGNLQIVIDGFRSFTLIASKILLEEKLGAVDKTGLVKFEPEGWYPLERWLNTLERIEKEFGSALLYQSGTTTPKHAVFPPAVVDIQSALKCIDVAYHMNHAVRGEPMFDPGTGQMREGIGHYLYEQVPGKNQIILRSTTPYPCDFDRGIITAMAQRFQPSAMLIHDASKPCRKRGSDTCSYLITWKP